MQNFHINQSLIEQKDNANIFEYLSKIRMINPYNSNERKELITILERINNQYNLKIDLNYKEKKLPSTKVPNKR